MSELKNVINLVMGDWSGDGHCKTQTRTIRCNITKKALSKAYTAGAKKTGVAFSDDVARDYEDSTISKDIIEKLAVFGFKIEEYSEDEEADEYGRYGLCSDGYAEAWLFVAKVGNPKLEYEFMDSSSSNINIGGYGLLGS